MEYIKDFKFEIVHHGELAAGIRSYTESVTINVTGGIAEDIAVEFREMLRTTLAEWFDGAEIHTDDEYRQIIEAERATWPDED